jgi:hypothetical protein
MSSLNECQITESLIDTVECEPHGELWFTTIRNSTPSLPAPKIITKNIPKNACQAPDQAKPPVTNNIQMENLPLQPATIK